MKIHKYLFVLLILINTNAFAQSWKWARQGIGSISSNVNEGNGVATDMQGNIYLTGFFMDTITFGTIVLRNPGSFCPYLVKYDSGGNLIWAKQPKLIGNNDGLNEAFSVAAGRTGNIYMTGSFYDTIAFGKDTLRAGQNHWGVFIVKYDASGNVLWAKQSYGNPNSCYSSAVTTDTSNNVYITGDFIDTVAFGPYILTAPKNYNSFITKYDVNGNAIWAKQGVTPNDISPNNLSNSNWVSSDKSGGIYITGIFQDTVVFGSFTLICTSASEDIFLVKYDVNGNVVWANQANTNGIGASYYLYGNAVTTDRSNNIYITGYYNGSFIFESDTTVNTGGVPTIFLAKYNSSGSIIWLKTAEALDSHPWAGYSLATDASEHVYLGGGAYPSPGKIEIAFGRDTFNLNNGSDPAILVELDSLGNTLCGAILPSGGDDQNGIAISPSGSNVYFGGDLWDNTIVFGNDTIGPPFPPETVEWPFLACWHPCDIITDTIPKPPKIVCESLFIPMAFSPNKDGRNDILYVRGDCIKTMDFVIFDRWGNKVFESNSLSIGWDGTFKGQPMNSGSFVYYLKATLIDGSQVEKKGGIALIR